MLPVKIRCNNADILCCPVAHKGVKLHTVRMSYCEYAISSKVVIPEGVTVTLHNVYENVYGKFLDVFWEDTLYTIKPINVDWLEEA